MPVDVDAVKATLEAERSSLVEQLKELGATERGDLTGDVSFPEGFADAGAATAERTELIGLVEALTSQVDEIDAALARLGDGTYGVCVSCGSAIDEARLEFRPSSIYCVDCKTARKR